MLWKDANKELNTFFGSVHLFCIFVLECGGQRTTCGSGLSFYHVCSGIISRLAGLVTRHLPAEPPLRPLMPREKFSLGRKEERNFEGKKMKVPHRKFLLFWDLSSSDLWLDVFGFFYIPEYLQRRCTFIVQFKILLKCGASVLHRFSNIHNWM